MQTRHSERYNWLIHSKSPYLLQHAENPVDWYEWGEEAFERARTEGKPIFLSIGYSTCHWCHVLAHESFEDAETASVLNERFVSIKVDREERPDIDQIYMTAAQLMNGQGGWPLSVFMTPDQTPFFIGTYFPKKPHFNQPSFTQVIVQLAHHYSDDPAKVSRIGQEVKEALMHVSRSDGRPLDEDVLHDAFDQLMREFDTKNGGFGGAPKFPSLPLLSFLLEYHRYAEDETALQMVMRTLTAIREGGIYDQVGFGVARYAVDAAWEIPHFEKMLYDNALFAFLCAETFQLTGRPRFRVYAEEVFLYIESVMTSPEGAFYSAEDADSEGREGTFYVWQKSEIDELLGPDSLFAKAYGVTAEGNFEGANVLRRTGQDFNQLAEQAGLDPRALMAQLASERRTLLAVRNTRTRPGLDDKVLTSQNALMIAAYARASRAFDEPVYLERARRAARFIEEHLVVDGRLMVRWRDGEVKGFGLLDDYAYLASSYLELYDATLDVRDLLRARELVDDAVRLFYDDAAGSFFFTGTDQEELMIRSKEHYDGVLPSGNSVMARLLLRLSQLTGETDYEEKAFRLFSSTDVRSQPTGHAALLEAYCLTEHVRRELIVLTADDEDATAFLSRLRRKHLPELAILTARSGHDLACVAPFVADYRREGPTTAYLCENFVCNLPTSDLPSIERHIH
ncbi:thioredoxin domain-containing protein [Exiguobacterium flavidum]|uniref:thioredoxin domain-containing protein n=1 Tax=Exiguobacterium flavidum TaxID=2184695 RepID=UPI000DF83431|nr:thioredoxin domain-containing protein [Exiguobacterium flavidum]